MKEVEIDLDLYNAVITVVRGTKKQLEQKKIDINEAYDVVILWDSEDNTWWCFNIGWHYFIFIEWKQPDILVHELYHLVNKISMRIGLPINKENDEFWAYLIWYLYKKALPILK